MAREHKSFPFAVKAISGREVTGIFSVFGNLDEHNDRIWPGAFSKTLQERGNRILHLWQHDFGSPPIAVVKSIREISRAELPSDVLNRAPDAMGGAEVVREYLDTPRADEVLAAIKAGSPLEMSFAFDAVKYDFEELPDAKYEWQQLRNLRELRLYETSDVLWGANGATVGSKSALAVPLDFLLRQLSERLSQISDEIKAGQRHNAEDVRRINDIAQLALDLGATNVKLLDEQLDDDASAAKSRADDQSLTLSTASYLYRTQLAERSLALLTRSI